MLLIAGDCYAAKPSTQPAPLLFGETEQRRWWAPVCWVNTQQMLKLVYSRANSTLSLKVKKPKNLFEAW